MTGTEMVVALVKDGTLEIRPDGTVWRVRAFGKPCEPRQVDHPTRKGYRDVTVGVPGTRRTRSAKAHRVIWVVAHGPIADGLQINHKDLNRANNRLDNLEVVDASGNIRHSYANGRPNPWHKATVWRGKSRITPEQKEVIRAMRSEGKKLREIGKQFNLSETHVSTICHQKGGAA